MSTQLEHSALHDRHVALGAKMADFGGWEMPIEYPGGGVIAEHTAVRERVGIFDVSHLGKGSVRGPGARDFLNTCLTNDLDRVAAGHAQYTMCCDASGGVVDDLIAYVHGPDAVLLVPNAANTTEVMQRIAAAAPPEIVVRNEHKEYGVLAVQGPKSAAVLDAVGLPTDLSYMQYAAAPWHDHQVFVCRTGYTGEPGFELLPTSDESPQLWDALIDAASAYGGLPCGLGARDTLRTEMGYPLHGHELSLEISPVQARAGWAVGWNKPAFWGRDALLREKAAGPARVLRGLKAADRAIPRAGMSVRDEAGTQVGLLTSGTFSPTLRVGIGLALLDAGVTVGSEVQVDVRGRPATMTVVNPPFVEASPK
ncbi:MAG: glycine cleavage system aminomethyltransferase GcvT [Mycobacteriales bacterium]